ncbi:MAG: hypothetical protein KDA54_14655 [Phycisphaerales bacterium]|nr:hypothetical protein [Phycisphaerales bacterium]
MRSNHHPVFKTQCFNVGAAMTVLFSVVACGCSEYINPWTDETVSHEYVTTASVEGARLASAPVDPAVRSFQPKLISPQDGTVGHFPLGWEDPFEDRGSDDGQFAWTAEDYFAMPYGHGRFILNTIAIPASVIVQPPVPLMGSDGITSRQCLGLDHDAEWLPAGRSSTPPDIIEIGSIPSSSIDTGNVESGTIDRGHGDPENVEPVE